MKGIDPPWPLYRDIWSLEVMVNPVIKIQVYIDS